MSDNEVESTVPAAPAVPDAPTTQVTPATSAPLATTALAPARPAGPPPPELSERGQAIATAIKALGLPLSEPKPDHAGHPQFEVAVSDLREVGRALRDKYPLPYLSVLATVDWPDRWESVYYFYDFALKGFLALKARIPKDELVFPSVTDLWPVANWWERENYDMYGVEFAGHPHLCRILMSDDWQTFPLRKDHPMDMEGGY